MQNILCYRIFKTKYTRLRMKLVKGYLGPDFQMEGNLSSSDSIRIDGTYIGMVSSEHSVTVGALGKVKGQIEAPLIQINGCVEGNLKATRLLEVLKNAQIEGDIFTPSGGLKFMIGGAFKGNLFVIPLIQN